MEPDECVEHLSLPQIRARLAALLRSALEPVAFAAALRGLHAALFALVPTPEARRLEAALRSSCLRADRLAAIELRRQERQRDLEID
jgi:hypothetical protein